MEAKELQKKMELFYEPTTLGPIPVAGGLSIERCYNHAGEGFSFLKLRCDAPTADGEENFVLISPAQFSLVAKLFSEAEKYFNKYFQIHGAK